MSKTIQEKVINTFKDTYHAAPDLLVSAPGRINLIGEHTDYSEGFVLPVAINLGISIALSPRSDNILDLHSIDIDEVMHIELDQLSKDNGGWQEYVKGVAWALSEEGYDLKGWQGVVAGDIPIGAGLSSSAALEIAAAKAFCEAGGFSLTGKHLAKIGKKAEVDWVGVSVGIMDQLISAEGKTNHAVKLDCRSLDTVYVPIPDSVCFVVLDTMTRRELAHSEYNTRHAEIKAVSAALNVPKLRDATLAMLEQEKSLLPAVLYQRARHVLSENERVHAFSKAMEDNNIIEMGRLINESHISLRDDFDVSSEGLNLIVELAMNAPHCLGARMTGAGFGGCALALLEQDYTADFIMTIESTYLSETGIHPHIFAVSSADGVQALYLN